MPAYYVKAFWRKEVFLEPSVDRRTFCRGADLGVE